MVRTPRRKESYHHPFNPHHSYAIGELGAADANADVADIVADVDGSADLVSVAAEYDVAGYAAAEDVYYKSYAWL